MPFVVEAVLWTTVAVSGRKPGTSWGKNASTMSAEPITTTNARITRSSRRSETR
jgi:hypothetical protein